MADVSGRLITDLHPNGTVRIVFRQHFGGRYERPQTVKSLDIAEEEFADTPGMTPGKAAVLRAELSRNKIADTVVRIDEEVAAPFRDQPLRKD